MELGPNDRAAAILLEGNYDLQRLLTIFLGHEFLDDHVYFNRPGSLNCTNHKSTLSAEQVVTVD